MELDEKVIINEIEEFNYWKNQNYKINFDRI